MSVSRITLIIAQQGWDRKVTIYLKQGTKFIIMIKTLISLVDYKLPKENRAELKHNASSSEKLNEQLEVRVKWV